MATRIFAGKMGTTYRIRIAQKGFNAADPALPLSHLQFDSAWPFSATIHAYGWTHPPSGSTTGPTSFKFGTLPYVPLVYVCPYFGGSSSQYELTGFYGNGMNGIVVTQNSVIYGPRRRTTGALVDDPLNMLVIVFRTPALNVVNTGLVAANAPRMLIGRRGASFGTYVSRPKFDVTTCPEGALLFSTDRTLAQIRWASHGDMNSGLVSGEYHADKTVAIPDQGFIPLAIGYVTPRQRPFNNFVLAATMVVTRTTVTFHLRSATPFTGASAAWKLFNYCLFNVRAP